jgi:NAD(P)-dependent dehydrogenase (short-subunit alcohol dehydrogenase family)
MRWPGQARVSCRQRLPRSQAGQVRDQGEQGGTREGALLALAREIEALERRVKPGDAADTDAAAAMAEATIRDLGQLDILVDNAAGAARSRSRTDLAGTTSGVRRDRAHKCSWRVGDERRDDPPPAQPRCAGPDRQHRLRCGTGGLLGALGVLRVEVRGHRVTQVMAPELAEYRIIVNAVCAGAIAPDRNDATRRRAQGAGNPGAVIAHSSPAGRLGVPADVASTVRFLVDPVAGYITGSPMLSPAGCTRPGRCIHVASSLTCWFGHLQPGG